MATYRITDPTTGRKIKLTGDSPPTEQELNDIFGAVGAPKQGTLSDAIAQIKEPQRFSPQSLLEGVPALLSNVAHKAGTYVSESLARPELRKMPFSGKVYDAGSMNPNAAAAIGTAISMGPDIAMAGINPMAGTQTKNIPNLAVEAQRRALGFKIPELKTVFGRGQAARSARVALEQGITSATGSPKEIFRKASDLASKSGRELGQIRESVGPQPIKPIISALDDYKSVRLKGASGGKWDAVLKKIEDAKETVAGVVSKGTGKVSLKRISEAKKEIADSVNWMSDNVSQKDAKGLEASWNALKTNGTQNFGAISKGFNKIWSDGNGEIKKSTETFDDWVANQKSGNANVVKNAKDSNAEKAKNEADHQEWIMKLKEDTEEKIKKIDDAYTKFLYDEYQKRSKIIDSAVEKITENNTQRWYGYSKNTINLEEWKAGKIKELNDKVGKYQKESIEKGIADLEKSQETFENIFENSFDSITKTINDFYEYLDKKSKEGETSAERQGAALNKAFLEPMKENVNAAKAFISGDYLGAAKGIAGYFEGLWKTTIGIKKTLNEIALNELNLKWEETMSMFAGYSDQIKENFEGLADSSIEFNQTQKTGTDALIEAEIKRAGQIKETYSLALSKEDELYQQKLKNIESVYNQEVLRINAKYDLENQLANQRFDSDSLLIQQGLNNSLLALITNEESKTSLTSEYAGRRSSIMQAFALADTVITETTSEAERTAINAAIEARTKALSELESWFTTELEFTVNSEDQKRREYSATAQLIKDAADAQRELDITYTAESIEREKNKQLEIETANATRKANELVAETNHNNELVRLGQEKDTALLNSFNALKEAMKNGYAEILASASEAYTKGLITAEQYLAKLREIQALRGLVGESTPSLTNEIRDRLRNLGIPGFKDGTELVGGIPGIDKNLAWLSHDEAVIKGETNRKKLQAGLTNESAIQYAISYKSILDGGFSPLTLKDNILTKLEERAAMQYLLNMNTQPIIDELKEVRQTLSKLPIQKFVYDKDGVNQYEQTKNSVKIYRKKRFE